MTYKEVVEKVRKEFGNADVSKYEDHLALQFNIIGEGEGAFYVEIIDGSLKIEEFDYINNNAMISASSDNIIDIFSGKLDMNSAVDSGKIEITGDYAKALSIQPVIEDSKKTSTKATAKKTAEKKPAAKKTAASKKAASKSEAKAETKTSAKTASKKSSAKKVSK